jgi:glycosyltransferase involved in cell wall biosynthesis
MYHADLLGAITARASGIAAPIIWNIRHSTLRNDVDARTTFWTAKLCAALSRRLPARIIVNSEAGKMAHASYGYWADGMRVIPNGFELDEFRPSNSLRRQIRQELGVGPNSPLVGIIGRYHPQKDHVTFIDAAQEIVRRCPDVRFLMCGRDVTWQNDELSSAIAARKLRKHVRLIGPRDDVPAIHASLDISVSSSICGEGFSNVLAESMACGVPCVATDVGDARRIVANAGRIVPPRSATALASAVVDLIQLPPLDRKQLGKMARQRIVENYEIGKIATHYTALWDEVLEPRRQSASQPRAA